MSCRESSADIQGWTEEDDREISWHLAYFLFQYRITPHTTTGASPVELLMGPRLRSHLDLPHPRLESHVWVNQRLQKAGHDQHTQSRPFELDDSVYASNFTNGPRWLLGVVTTVCGALSYSITLSDNSCSPPCWPYPEMYRFSSWGDHWWLSTSTYFAENICVINHTFINFRENTGVIDRTFTYFRLCYRDKTFESCNCSSRPLWPKFILKVKECSVWNQ